MTKTAKHPVTKRIWLVSEVYFPEEVGTGYYMTKLAEGLARHGSVNVLCGPPTYSARGTVVARRETLRGVQIERCRATSLNKDVLALRLINLVTISLSIFCKALFGIGRKDVVLVVTNPPLLPFFIALACRLRGAKCVLRVDDVYPEALIATGLARPNGVVVRILALLTRRLYQSVDRIIVLGRDMEQLARKKLSRSTEKIEIIPNWADVDEILPSAKAGNSLLKELGLTGKFVVQCAGNMGRAQNIESMFKAIESLRSEKGIHFLFIGSGSKWRWMENEVREKRLKNVTMLGQRPRHDQPIFLNACDVALASLVPGMTGAGVPSRMYNIMAAGKPIIAVAESGSELSLVTSEEQIGWVVPPDEPDSLARAVLDARSDPERLLQMGIRARNVAEEKYPIDRIIGKYSKLLDSVA